MAAKMEKTRYPGIYRRVAPTSWCGGTKGGSTTRVLNPAADRAGVPWATFHTFRHTCASMLFEEGRNLAQVAGWLGHADPAFTLRTYVHLMDGGLGDADFLDGITSPPLRRVA